MSDSQKKINCRCCTVVLRNDEYIEVEFVSDAVISVDDVLELNEASDKLCNGIRYPRIVDISRIKYATKEAREVGADPKVLRSVKKNAIVAASAITRMIGQVYISINRPVVPTRLFTDREEAVAWLLSSVENQELLSDVQMGNKNNISDAIDVLSNFTQKNFFRRLSTETEDLLFNQLAVAINMLGDELEHNTVTRERLGRILNTSPSIFYSLELKEGQPNGLKFISDSIQTMGYNKEEFLKECPNCWSACIHPEDLEEVRMGFAKALGQEKFSHKYRFRRKDGNYVWVLDSFSVIRDLSGKVTEVIGFVTDVEEEVRLASRAQLLEKLLDKVAIIATTDLYGRINSVNRNFCEISGYSEVELMGKDHRLLNSGYHGKAFFRDLWETIQAGKIWRGEIKNRRKNRSYYWVDSTIAPILNRKNQIEGYISYRIDITQKREQQHKLLSTSKMASLGEMAGGIAHEINNPLAIIQGKAEQLKRKLQSGDFSREDFAKSLELITSTTARINKIIQGLRNFSRDAEKDPFEVIGLKQIVEDTLALCEQRFKENGVVLECETVPEINLECRSTQISQVLLNILGNAFDAVEHLEQKWVKISFHEQQGYVEIAITDSGRGIPEEIASKMLQPFFTTKGVGKGTGLGLSVSNSIIMDHGGEIKLDTSCPNTRFILKLKTKQAKIKAIV